MKKFFGVFILLTSFSYCITAQYGTVPIIENFTPDIYKSHNQNWEQIQMPNDVMYFANGDGLLEFDGVNWQLYRTKELGSLLSLDTFKNEIYAGGIGEFGKFISDSLGKIKYVDLTELIPDSSKSNITNVWKTFYIQNKVYFVTFNTIYIYENNKVKVVPFNGKIIHICTIL